MASSIVHSVRGRVYARQGKVDEGVAELRSAREHAKRGQSSVFEAFVLVDLKATLKQANLPPDDGVQASLKGAVDTMVSPCGMLVTEAMRW